MISIVRRQNICRMSGTSWIGHAMAHDAELNGDLFTISTVEAHGGALFSTEQNPAFWLWSAAIALIYGLSYAIDTWRAWPEL